MAVRSKQAAGTCAPARPCMQKKDSRLCTNSRLLCLEAQFLQPIKNVYQRLGSHLISCQCLLPFDKLHLCQVELKDAIDLRHASLGPRGYKVKPIKSGTSSLQKVQAAAAQQDEPHGMDTDTAEPYAAPAVKRQRAEGVPYRNVSTLWWCRL